MDLASYLIREQGVRVELVRSIPLRERVARAAQSILLQFLLRSGGALRRPIVLEEKVCEGRLWELVGAYDLGLGPASSHVLENLEQALQQDHSVHLPNPGEENGDAFFFHGLLCHIVKDLSLRRFSSSLRRASPLTRLCSCPILGTRESVQLPNGEKVVPAVSREEVRALVRHPVFGYLLGFLADQWSEIELPDAQTKLEIQLERIQTRCATLQLFLEEAEASGKFSVLVVFPLFFQRLLRRRYTQQVLQVNHFKQWRRSQREQLLFAHAGFFQLGERLEQVYRRQVVDPGPYGWSHPMEIRTFAGKYGRLWSSGGLREEVRQAERELRQEL